MGPKIGPCRTPKSIFRKSLNSESALVFLFSVIGISRKYRTVIFYRNRKRLILLLVNRSSQKLWRGQGEPNQKFSCCLYFFFHFFDYH